MADSFVADSFTPDTPSTDASKKGGGASGSWETKPLSHPRLPLEVMFNPQGPVEHIASIGLTAPLFGVGGKLGGAAVKGLGALAEKVGPSLGRMATGAGIGVGSSAARGESPTAMGAHGVADALITGLVEATLGKLAKPGRALAKDIKGISKTIQETIESNKTAQAAYEWAKRAPMEAMEAIRSRVPNSFNVPIISEALAKAAGTTIKHMPAKDLTLDEAVEGLTKLRGKDYEEALIQLKRQLNLREFSPRLPRAGESFAMRVSPYIKDPVPAPVPTLPANPRALIGSDTARAVADTLATHDVYGLPVGAAAPLMIPGGLGKMATHAIKAALP